LEVLQQQNEVKRISKIYLSLIIIRNAAIKFPLTISIYAGRELEFRQPGARRPIKERKF
jgi:hypothetical protein